MNRKSIKALFEGLEDGKPAGGTGMSAAEKLGRAVLDSLGTVEGADEDELVEAILGEWKPGRAETERPAGEAGEAFDPFGARSRRPVPMRAGSGAPSSVDYADMSPKQFSELKRLLKKAAADGKRIKI